MTYASVRECMAAWSAPSAANVAKHKSSADEARDMKPSRAAQWIGAPSFSEAHRRVLEGWPEGYARAAALARTLALPALPKRRRVRFSDDGPDLNLDRYLDGADVCWNVRKRMPVPTVDVSVTIGGTADVDADALFWRGAAALALTDTLERAGYRVRLTALSFSVGSFADGTSAYTRVTMKDYSEPLRPGHLAGAICAPALFRIGVFGSRFAAPLACDWSLGRTGEPGAAETAPLHIGVKVVSESTARTALATLQHKVKVRH